ncbi:unnamed protein product, partial [Mesorhabditis belari]|uniref:Uncharacterized protein n=1 Tax=Mesorhabditis belari TaxID=2138241 RepID=A0AAF3FRP4_9BILA
MVFAGGEFTCPPNIGCGGGGTACCHQDGNTLYVDGCCPYANAVCISPTTCQRAAELGRMLRGQMEDKMSQLMTKLVPINQAIALNDGIKN